MASLTDSERYITGWRLGVIITSLFFGTFLLALDTTIVNVAIPKITTDFRALDDVAWYGSAYLVTLTALQPVYGSMYKFFDASVVYRISIVIFEVGSVLCAAASSSSVFILGRALAGFGGAGLLQGALSIISQVIPLEKRPMYMGIVISVFGISVCIGPPLGGVFTVSILRVQLLSARPC
jgi:MFS family permease